MVCRCEEVTVGQGCMCGLTVSQLLASELGKPVAEVGAYRIRSPLKPVPLTSLASLCTEPDNQDSNT
ncbi:MAG: BFD-like protein [Comamonadaceae bacterium]|nr:MAG: BFD-like protein [Comamonadaceae bacterium]